MTEPLMATTTSPSEVALCYWWRKYQLLRKKSATHQRRRTDGLVSLETCEQQLVDMCILLCVHEEYQIRKTKKTEQTKSTLSA